MKKLLFAGNLALIGIITLHSACSTKQQDTIKDTISSYNIISNNFKNDSLKFVIADKDSTLRIIAVNKRIIGEMEKKQFFNIVIQRTNDSTMAQAISIIPLDSTAQNKESLKLIEADADDIDDFKRHSNASFAIIDKPNGDMVVVNTPKKEISRMLRLESFKFFYYKNWDGKYYYDHIENPSE